MHTKSHFFNDALHKALSVMAVFLLFSAAVYGQFSVVSPAQGGVGVSQTPTFSWSTGDPGPYHIQVFEAIAGWTPASDPNYDGAKMVYENTSVTSTSITPGTYTNTLNPAKLDAKKRYVWFLRTSDNVWHSSATVGYNFVTLGDAPVFTYPVNTLTGVPVLPIFSWTFPGGLTAPVSVSLSVIKVEPGAVAVTVNPANDATSYTWTDVNGILSNNASYNVTLTYTDANGVSGSKTINFKTFAVTAFGLSLPIDGQTNVPRSALTLYWYNTAGGVKYWVELKASATEPTAAEWASPTITLPNLTSTNVTVGNLAFNQKYYWRVKAQNAFSGYFVAVSNVYSFTTGGGVVKPYLSYPVAQPVYENLPTFYWWGLNFDPQNVYDLNIYDALGTTLIYQKTNISGTNHKLEASNFLVGSALAGNTTYTWLVIAKSSAAGEQTFSSDATTFTTLGTGTVYQPVCSYPTDLSEVYSVTPTLYWYLGGTTSGITYTVTLSTDPLFGVGTIVESGTGTDELNYAVSTNLTAGQTYYWKVKASNGTQELESLPASFVVSASLAPGNPVASWPVDNPTEYSATPALSWWIDGSSSGITGFDVVWTTGASAPADNTAWDGVFASASGTNSASVPGTATNYTLTVPQSLLSGTTYYWAVRKTGGTNWSAGSFTTVSATVASNGTPVPSWPVGGAQASSTTPLLSWWMNGSTAGLVSYSVEYSRTEDFAAGMDGFGPYTVLVTGLPANSMSYQIPSNSPLLQGTTYYWRVKAVFPASVTTVSANESFVVQSANGVIAPVAGSPVNNVQVKNNNPVLSWAIPTKTTASMTYEAQYSTKPDMSSPVTLTGLKSNKASVTGLKNGTYYWRVRSVDTKGTYSSYSSKESFVVTGTTAVEQRPGMPTDFVLEQNYPNPFNPSTVIRFSLPKESQVTLKIYDIMGQEVKTLLNETMNAGNFDVQWNGDDSDGNKVQSGTYIYRITTENNSVARKMILIK